jgi:hypothetical protein
MKRPPESGKAELSVARWTHLLAGLQARSTGLWIRTGNLESRALEERLAALAIDRPIYISGLARSGSTILLELLSRHADVATHRYKDFPPVLTPWLWNWFLERAATRQSAPQERAHGDGIRVTPESPEAFEEVVWMAFFPQLHDPERSAVLTAETENREFQAFYRDHIRKLLLIRSGKRYLAKANYNLTRFRYLLKLFPDAKFIVPFRDAPGHIASLMRQHARFLDEHRRDPRLQRHMSRSGHFEFGADMRPIHTGDTATIAQIRELWSHGREVEGWARYWSEVYGHVADLLETDAGARRACFVVRHETLCRRPGEVMEALLAHCELSRRPPDITALAETTIRRSAGARAPFDDAQLERIVTPTGAVAGRLERLAEQCLRSGGLASAAI